MFPFESFGPYKFAVQFLAIVTDLSAQIPRGHGELLDQLKRAAMSIVLNIAEGSGRTSRSDMRRFYSIARGSAMECVAILDVLVSLRLLTEVKKNEIRMPLQNAVAILTSICRPIPLPTYTDPHSPIDR